MFKKNDRILFLVILIAALLVSAVLYFVKSEGEEVLITVNGQEYDTLSLNTDTELTIELGNGAYNTLSIKDGEVEMTDANCPDKLCVKHDPIHYNNESVVCLPHKVVVEIINGEESDLDIIAR
ncbi:MAG: NusG domain II-containing protein [Lachnospiraceae bacterium]